LKGICFLALTCLLAFILELILGSILFLDDEVLKLSTYNFTSALEKIGILKIFFLAFLKNRHI
jgi:hypothetical protein